MADMSGNASKAWHRYRAQMLAHLAALDAKTIDCAHLIAIERLCRAAQAEIWPEWTASRRERRP